MRAAFLCSLCIPKLNFAFFANCRLAMASYFFCLLTFVRVLAAAQMNTAARASRERRAMIFCAGCSLTLLVFQLFGSLLPLQPSLKQYDNSALTAMLFCGALFITVAGAYCGPGSILSWSTAFCAADLAFMRYGTALANEVKSTGQAQSRQTARSLRIIVFLACSSGIACATLEFIVAFYLGVQEASDRLRVSLLDFLLLALLCGS